MANPSWLPPTQDPEKGECLRLAFSACTGVHPRRLRFIDPTQERVDFWREWERLSYERGFRWMRAERSFAEADPNCMWIAVVESLTLGPGYTHAIAMKGKKLYYDSGARKRKRAPTKLCANPIIPTRIIR